MTPVAIKLQASEGRGRSQMSSPALTERTELVVDDRGVVLVDPRTQGSSELVDMQLMLVTTSMNHEYSRKEYEKTGSYDRQQELLIRMSQLKELYFSVRDKLSLAYPERLEVIEKELRFEKQTVLSDSSLQ